MPASRVIYVGIKGSVLAIEAVSGRQLWATHLKGSDFVNVVLDGDRLYAATHGELFCLNPQTGEGLWHNPLKRFGYGLATIATETITPNALMTILSEARRREEAAAAAASAAATAG